jgi:hypothetical protein
MSDVYIFNQYYVELLKACKTHAKAAKDRQGSRGKMARDLLRAIKKHYSSFDKMSPDHIAFFKGEVGAAAHEYVTLESVDAAKAFVAREDLMGSMWFMDIPYSLIKAFGHDIHQNWTTMGLLVEEGVDAAKLVEVSRKMSDKKEFEEGLEAAFGENDLVKAAMKRLRTIWEEEVLTKKGKDTPFAGLDGMEETSLGRLAKEIMEDPEVQDLHASFKTAMDGAEGGGGPENLMNMFGNGEQGANIAKLMGTVSQKMIQKLMTGEIKQETLLQDAMQFAGKLGGMPGGFDMSSIGNMLSGMAGAGGGGGGGGGFDFSSLLNAFGGGGGEKKQKTAKAPAGAAARGAGAAQRARRKLDARRKLGEQQEKM